MGWIDRRKLLLAASGAAFVALAPSGAAALVRTPNAAEGPYYPTPAMRFEDVDNDLVKVASAVKQAGGEIIILRGRVLDSAGAPVTGARVEIWQCDANGRYLHTRERGRQDRDPAFQGFGHYVTGTDGAYWFRTIKPVPYPGRAPHIHVKVHHDGRELTTQLYLPNEPRNARDVLYGRMTEAQRTAVTMNFGADRDGVEATVNLVL